MMQIADYIIFGLMLVISLSIGAYHAIMDRKANKGTEGYLMAGRTMTAIPAGISIAVTFQSSVTVLGFPNDVYLYGITFIWTLLSLVLTLLAVCFVFIPVLYKLQIRSVYEYLDMRFNKFCRLVSTVTYLLTNLFYMGINIYGPAITLSAVTGWNILVTMTTTSFICALYTALGGLKGVIWADVVQGSVMLSGMLAVIIRGSIIQEGFDGILEVARRGGRTTMNYSADPRFRYTFWTMTVGQVITWTATCGTNQAQVQRILSSKTRMEAIKAATVGVCGICLFATLATLCGLVGYSIFHECDPRLAGCVERRDEIYPFAVANILRGVPGLMGLFLSCVYAASFSTVSSGLNSMVTVIVADLVKPHTNWSEENYAWTAKAASFLSGCAALGVGILASMSGDIVKIGIGGASAFIGPSLGVFVLGIFCPYANAWGAIFGTVCGYTAGMTMFLGSIGLKRPGHVTGLLDISSTSCPVNCDFSTSSNTTYVNILQPTASTDTFELHGIENVFALSVYYTSLIAFLSTLAFGSAASLLTGGWKSRHAVPEHLVMRPILSGNFVKRICGRKDSGLDCKTELPAEDNISTDEERRKLYIAEM